MQVDQVIDCGLYLGGIVLTDLTARGCSAMS